MLSSYITAIIIVCFLMVLWMFVQFAWRKVFPGVADDEDVLAGRKGCGSCSHEFDCQLSDKKSGNVTNFNDCVKYY